MPNGHPSQYCPLIWPFPLTAFTFRSCLYCGSQAKDWWAVNFNSFSQRDNMIPPVICPNDVQYKHEWVVRVNDQINDVKQLLAWAILGWVTIWQPQFFFSLAETLGKLGKLASSVWITERLRYSHLWWLELVWGLSLSAPFEFFWNSSQAGNLGKFA